MECARFIFARKKYSLALSFTIWSIFTIINLASRSPFAQSHRWINRGNLILTKSKLPLRFRWLYKYTFLCLHIWRYRTIIQECDVIFIIGPTIDNVSNLHSPTRYQANTNTSEILLFDLILHWFWYYQNYWNTLPLQTDYIYTYTIYRLNILIFMFLK